MPNRYIYVLQGGEYDYSRWLSLAVRPNGEATVYLSDLCHPGRVSALKSVNAPLELLLDGLQSGTVQIVAPNGYFLARRDEEKILIEFRSPEDAGPSKVEVRADEVLQKLELLRESVPVAA